MAGPCELKNWKIEILRGDMHVIGHSGGMRIKSSPVVKIEGESFETAIGAKFILKPREMSKTYWEVVFRTQHPVHFDKVKHLFT